MFQQSRSNDAIHLTSSVLAISYFHSTMPKMKKQKVIIRPCYMQSMRQAHYFTLTTRQTHMINYAEKDEVTSGRKHYSYKVQVHWALNALNAFFCHPPPFPFPIVTIKSIPVSRLCI